MLLTTMVLRPSAADTSRRPSTALTRSSSNDSSEITALAGDCRFTDCTHDSEPGCAVRAAVEAQQVVIVPRAFDEFIAAAREVPEVIEIQTFLGRVDVRLQVLARDMGHYQSVYRDRILPLPHIADIEALMQVATIKTDPGLPV